MENLDLTESPSEQYVALFELLKDFWLKLYKRSGLLHVGLLWLSLFVQQGNAITHNLKSATNYLSRHIINSISDIYMYLYKHTTFWFWFCLLIYGKL